MKFLDDFVNQCHESLLDSDVATKYLLKRGSTLNQWKKHRIGFVSSPFKAPYWDDRYHSDKCFEKGTHSSLLCDSCRFNRWSSSHDDLGFEVSGRILNSIVLPITSYSGTLYGIQCRNLKEKVYNTFTFRHKPEAIFFGIAANIQDIWDTKFAILVEGPFDQLVIDNLLDNRVISLMTNEPNPTQLSFLRRFLNKMVISFDRDKAGNAGFESLSGILSNERILVEKIKYPRVYHKDIGEYYEEFGSVKFLREFQEYIWKKKK